MTRRISAHNLIREGWQQGLGALAPNLTWIAAFAAAAGAYSVSLRLPGTAASLAMVVITFLVGVQLSRGLYARLIGPRPGGYLQLAHANLAVYLAFLFIGFFVGFFLLILPGILIEAQGKYEIGADAAPELVQRAFLDMLATPYGAFYLLVCAAGVAAISYFALRLTLFGAATFDRRKAQVFTTYPWTRGQWRKLGAAALATHVLPFFAGLGANYLLQASLPDAPLAHAVEGAGGILLFTPFLLAGHGMAAAAYRRLKPEAAGEAPLPG